MARTRKTPAGVKQSLTDFDPQVAAAMRVFAPLMDDTISNLYAKACIKLMEDNGFDWQNYKNMVKPTAADGKLTMENA